MVQLVSYRLCQLQLHIKFFKGIKLQDFHLISHFLPASVEFCMCTILSLWSWLTIADTMNVVTKNLVGTYVCLTLIKLFYEKEKKQYIYQ